MTRRWIPLLLCAVLLPALRARSPLPVPDDEWESFTRQMRDPAYRLPTTSSPHHYEVSLTPYFEVTAPSTVTPFTFDGEVAVYLSTTLPDVSELVLHCNDLTVLSLSLALPAAGAPDLTVPGASYTCEMPWSFLRVPTTQPLDPEQEYVLRVSFRGNLQTNMRGFYRSWYDDSTGRRWMATTQFQPGHARQAFPCYDEPGFKATFDITVAREPDFSPTISNMPIRETVTLTSGRVAETFYTTPLTSTYLLAVIVSHYSRVASGLDASRPFAIYARDNAGATGDWALEIGEALLTEMEDYTQFPYYTMASSMDMKQAAIPDFSAGAMENWGLLTYREALILYDPLNSNHFYRQRVANIVSHEIAHMWFGNLVTCAWWDNLWLNEGFARFYQYYLTGAVRPELGYATRFIPEQVHTALLSDSLDSAHALTEPGVNDPAAVSAHFSTITYAKGAAVLRMTQHLLGEDTYRKALRNYLVERQFDVAEPQHLFQALDAAAVEDGALSGYGGITINGYFRTWSEQAGHPLLTVTIDQRTGQMIVTQARWERNTGVSAVPTLWQVPITWTRGGAPEFEDLKPVTVLTAQSSVLQRNTSGLEWVIFNKQQSGFYRVNYDPTNWALITRALRGEERSNIHEFSRAQIVDDVFVLARAGVLPYQRAFNILSFLEFEDAYAPWLSAITGFNFVMRRLAHDPDNLQKLREEIARLSMAVTTRLGFAETPGETYMAGLQRMYVNEFLCNAGHEQCLAAAVQSFQSWRNGAFVPANMRPWVYCAGLRAGSAADFDYFWNRYLLEDLAGEKVVMLQTAGCTSDATSLGRFLDAIVAGDDAVRPQDFTTALNSAVSGNEFNTLRVFEWLKSNVAQTTETLGSVATPLSYIAARLLDETQIVEFENWLQDNQDAIGTSAYNTGINGAASARANLLWSANRASEFAQYFETGYVEENLDDVLESGEDEEEDVGGGEEDAGGEEGDGEEDAGGDDGDGSGETGAASFAALSSVTLVVTLAANLMA